MVEIGSSMVLIISSESSFAPSMAGEDGKAQRKTTKPSISQPLETTKFLYWAWTTRSTIVKHPALKASGPNTVMRSSLKLMGLCSSLSLVIELRSPTTAQASEVKKANVSPRGLLLHFHKY